MINDLDKTLEELIKKELPGNLVDQVAISFAAPDDQFPPTSVSLPAIDIFLYDLRENKEFRNNEWLVERGNGRVRMKSPPVLVDASYLITAWASDSSTSPVSDEHHMLGEVMKVMLRYPKLPEEALQGSLKNQVLSLPAIVLQPGHLQSMGEFWQALGGKPKVALNYTVTISIDVLPPIDSAIVLEKIIDIKPSLDEGE